MGRRRHRLRRQRHSLRPRHLTPRAYNPPLRAHVAHPCVAPRFTREGRARKTRFYASGPGGGGSGGEVEPFGPARVGCAVAEDAPRDALRGRRRDMQTPTEFGWRLVTLGVVAPGAGGYHVVPLVLA